METVRYRASMPWTLVMMLLVLGVGTIVFVALGGVFDVIVGYVEPWAADNEHAGKGLADIKTIWSYWPLWFLAAVCVFGIVESVRKSRGGGV